MSTRLYAFLAAARYHKTTSERTTAARWGRLRLQRTAMAAAAVAEPQMRRRAVVVVTHSHFIRNFCCRYIREHSHNDAFATRLCKTNIANAKCIALDVDFTSPYGVYGASTEDAQAATAAAVLAGTCGIDAAVVSVSETLSAAILWLPSA
eukprot:SAG11_NODE_874_length_6773_cov_4.639114_4_plen_150_part_00